MHPEGGGKRFAHTTHSTRRHIPKCSHSHSKPPPSPYTGTSICKRTVYTYVHEHFSSIAAFKTWVWTILGGSTAFVSAQKGYVMCGSNVLHRKRRGKLKSTGNSETRGVSTHLTPAGKHRIRHIASYELN